MGGQSRLVGKGVRKLVAAMNTVGNDSGRRPTLFLINQIRMKIGLVFGNPETTPGGMAPGFAASTEIMFRSGKYEMDEITGKPLSVEMKFKIEKNKTSAAKMEGEYKMILSQTETKGVGEILEEDKMVEMGERMNLVEKKGADWYCIGEKFAAKSHIERRAMTDSAFKRKFGQALMTVLLSA
jgi:recombination protein RecA